MSSVVIKYDILSLYFVESIAPITPPAPDMAMALG